LTVTSRNVSGWLYRIATNQYEEFTHASSHRNWQQATR